MTAIENIGDLNRYESLFGGLWKSAIVRYSVIEVTDDLHIPNGEIIFSEDELDSQERVLYSEGPFKIVEETVDEPFPFLRDLTDGDHSLGRGVSLDLLEHHPEQRFLDDRESRVFSRRPRTEIHAVYQLEFHEDQETDYNQIIDDLEYRLQRAEEPYFHVGNCEYYYFAHHFRGKAKVDPEFLVFADTGIEFDVDEEDRVSVAVPEVILEQTAVSVLPQRPYGDHKGWRIELADREVKDVGDGRVEFTEELDLANIDETYIMLLVGDEILGVEDHYTSVASTTGEFAFVNPRHKVLDEYDFRNVFTEYLQGSDADLFELAVLNLFSTAGYQVQWFGEQDFKIPERSRDVDDIPYDEIDVIAHRPDGTQILFIECTNKGISEKESILDRTQRIGAALQREEPELTDVFETFEFGENRRKIVPVIATPQIPDELNPEVVADLTGKGIVVLDGETLVEVYEISEDQHDPVRVDIDPEMWDMDIF